MCLPLPECVCLCNYTGLLCIADNQTLSVCACLLVCAYVYVCVSATILPLPVLLLLFTAMSSPMRPLLPFLTINFSCALLLTLCLFTTPVSMDFARLFAARLLTRSLVRSVYSLIRFGHLLRRSVAIGIGISIELLFWANPETKTLLLLFLLLLLLLPACLSVFVFVAGEGQKTF